MTKNEHLEKAMILLEFATNLSIPFSSSGFSTDFQPNDLIDAAHDLIQRALNWENKHYRLEDKTFLILNVLANVAKFHEVSFMSPK